MIRAVLSFPGGGFPSPDSRPSGGAARPEDCPRRLPDLVAPFLLSGWRIYLDLPRRVLRRGLFEPLSGGGPTSIARSVVNVTARGHHPSAAKRCSDGPSADCRRPTAGDDIAALTLPVPAGNLGLLPVRLPRCPGIGGLLGVGA